MISIKGSVLRTRLALVAELAPNDCLGRVLAHLAPGERDTLTSLLASAWYPFELGKRLDEAIVEVLGAGRPEFFEKLGEASADKNLGPGGVHRSFLAAGDPHAFLEKTYGGCSNEVAAYRTVGSGERYRHRFAGGLQRGHSGRHQGARQRQ